MDEIWDLIESVSEGFPTYSSLSTKRRSNAMCFMANLNHIRCCRWINAKECKV